jgi:hypothetical protein
VGNQRLATSVLALAVVVLVSVRVVAVLVALGSPDTSGRHAVLTGDVRRYHRIAATHGTPYRDFAVEYPPVTLAAIELLDGGSPRSSAVAVMWTQLVLDVAVAGLLAWGWGRRAALAYLVLGLAFVWYPFLYLRLDLLSVALAVGALALLRRRRPVSGAVALAVSCFAKLWPVVLVPRVARRSWRAFAAFVVTGVAGLAAWVAWAGTSGPVQVLTYRGATGWQIESTLGAVVHAVQGGVAHIHQGAARIGDVPTIARVGLPLLGVAGAAGIWWVALRVRRPGTVVLDGLAPLGAVLAMLLTSTILSPQYVAWLLPFAAVAVAGGERLVGTTTFAAGALSTLELTMLHELNRGAPMPMAVVLARNAVLVALLTLVVVRLLARTAPVVSGVGVPVPAPAGRVARPVSVAAGGARRGDAGGADDPDSTGELVTLGPGR